MSETARATGAIDLPPSPETETAGTGAVVCPVCGAAAVQEKCKVVCRSDKCRGRIIFNCSEF